MPRRSRRSPPPRASRRSPSLQPAALAEATEGSRPPALPTTMLAMSAAAKRKLHNAVRMAGKAPTPGERRSMAKSLDLIAHLLAQQEVNKIDDMDAYSNAPHTPGFSSWIHDLSSPKTTQLVEKRVKDMMDDTNGPYSQSIRASIPKPYIKLLPALTAQAAQKATKSAFFQLKDEMVKAGAWDRGYLTSGDSLSGSPFEFGGKYKGDKEGLGKACESECKKHNACRGFTYNPKAGQCFLKAKSWPVRGAGCVKDCWYWGKVLGHPHEMSLGLKDAEDELGLQVHDLQVGKGEEIKKGDTATIGYIGSLDNGYVFDQGKYVFTFGAGQVIKGDDLGLQGMRVGGLRQLVMPSDLAYGSRGIPGLIPSNARLHFKVRLIKLSPTSINQGYKSSGTP